MTKTIVAKKPRMLFALIFSAFLLLKFIQEGISLSMLLLLILKTFYQHPPPGIIIRRRLHLYSILFFLLYVGGRCVCVDFLSVPMHVQSWGVPTNQDAPPMAVVYSMKNCAQNRSGLISPFFAKTPVISLIFQGLLRIVKKVSYTSRPFPIKVFFAREFVWGTWIFCPETAG